MVCNKIQGDLDVSFFNAFFFYFQNTFIKSFLVKNYKDNHVFTSPKSEILIFNICKDIQQNV